MLYQHGLNRLSLNTVVPFCQEHRFIFDQKFFVTSYSEGARMSLKTEVFRKVPRFGRGGTVTVRERTVLEILLGAAFCKFGA